MTPLSLVIASRDGTAAWLVVASGPGVRLPRKYQPSPPSRSKASNGAIHRSGRADIVDMAAPPGIVSSGRATSAAVDPRSKPAPDFGIVAPTPPSTLSQPIHF